MNTESLMNSGGPEAYWFRVIILLYGVVSILLPFAVFSIRALVARQQAELEKLNTTMARLLKAVTQPQP
jgi:hypothetical protein